MGGSGSKNNESNSNSMLMGSPSRFGSCRDTSTVVDDVFQSPARRSRLDLSMASAASPRATSRTESPVRKFAFDSAPAAQKEQSPAKKGEFCYYYNYSLVASLRSAFSRKKIQKKSPNFFFQKQNSKNQKTFMPKLLRML
jgi:hypothetical protein